jgi:hypothetical protein
MKFEIGAFILAETDWAKGFLVGAWSMNTTSDAASPTRCCITPIAASQYTSEQFQR